MPTYNLSCLNVQRDPETGCAYDCGESHNYQQCRQAYYLKQQNLILKNGQTDTKVATATNTPDPRIEDLQRQVSALQSQPINIISNFKNQNLFLGIIGILVIVIIFLTFKVKKGKLK